MWVYNQINTPDKQTPLARDLKRYIYRENNFMGIDWSKFTHSEDTCHCRCGEIFRSHAKYVATVKRVITRKQCPECSKDDDCWRVASDQETMTI